LAPGQAARPSAPPPPRPTIAARRRSSASAAAPLASWGSSAPACCCAASWATAAARKGCAGCDRAARTRDHAQSHGRPGGAAAGAPALGAGGLACCSGASGVGVGCCGSAAARAGLGSRSAGPAACEGRESPPLVTPLMAARQAEAGHPKQSSKQSSKAIQAEAGHPQPRALQSVARLSSFRAAHLRRIRQRSRHQRHGLVAPAVRSAEVVGAAAGLVRATCEAGHEGGPSGACCLAAVRMWEWARRDEAQGGEGGAGALGDAPHERVVRRGAPGAWHVGKRHRERHALGARGERGQAHGAGLKALAGRRAGMSKGQAMHGPPESAPRRLDRPTRFEPRSRGLTSGARPSGRDSSSAACAPHAPSAPSAPYAGPCPDPVHRPPAQLRGGRVRVGAFQPTCQSAAPPASDTVGSTGRPPASHAPPRPPPRPSYQAATGGWPGSGGRASGAPSASSSDTTEGPAAARQERVAGAAAAPTRRPCLHHCAQLPRACMLGHGHAERMQG
jgi:hypothetical protein